VVTFAASLSMFSLITPDMRTVLCWPIGPMPTCRPEATAAEAQISATVFMTEIGAKWMRFDRHIG